MLFDQGVFQQQGFFLGVSDDDLDPADLLHQQGDMLTPVATRRKIVAQPGPQPFGLADIENPTVLIKHLVDAGSLRIGFEIDGHHANKSGISPVASARFLSGTAQTYWYNNKFPNPEKIHAGSDFQAIFLAKVTA